jgi:malonyl-CoA O-methyltransferase
MNIANAYSNWAASYDTDRNLTRDLDFEVIRKLLGRDRVPVVVEAGCGTGKNTSYFSEIAEKVYAFDFSDGMLGIARKNLSASNIQFSKIDLLSDWPCPSNCADLISFNLVLEHIKDVVGVIRNASRVLRPGGRVLISELHPFKQYQNSQARFIDSSGVEVRIPAFTHNISEYLGAAEACGLGLVRINEWWHAEDQPNGVPRLVTFTLQGPAHRTAA